MRILVDADACPVKEQIYKVATRYGLPVVVVSNTWMRVPEQDSITLVQVNGGLDVADDWIAEETTADDIVATADLPLAGRVIDKGALCIDFRGREFTPDAVGGLLASREIASYLRGFGEYTGGPPPLNARDRGKFAGKLDEVVNRRLRERRNGR
ncbi:MAG: YaiI/YqxD family protein [Chloroflexi bacterium]|nr:YaiI/YqxD family protein [Chloroflexota bacterium]